jgi:alkylation response protein AidB-like acyl-CoA dehydrogenase
MNSIVDPLMAPGLRPELREIGELARKFCEKSLKLHVEHDEESETFRRSVIAELGNLGLTGLPVSESLGGAGLGYQELCVVLEEIAAVHAAYAISVAVTGLPQLILSRFGTPSQQAQWIPKLASGQAIGAFSLSEAGSGSDAASLRTTAKRQGDWYVIQGTKLWTTQADEADVILLMARTDTASGPRGISTFLLEKGTPGLQMGKREKKMGLSSSHTMEVLLDQVKVPASALVGNEGDGFRIAMTALDSGRITIAATALGVARGALEAALEHAKIRSQFGKPIGEFQGVSFLLADMATELLASRGLVERAARLRDEGHPFSLEAACAKLHATDMAMKVTTDAVQILGGAGYTREFPVERYMREAKVLQIVEGTNQIQRVVIGRGLTT